MGRVLAVWTFLNLLSAICSPISCARENGRVMAYRKQLRQLGAANTFLKRDVAGNTHIEALHFVFGMKQPEEFPFFAFMAIISAQAHHPQASTYFHCRHEPTGRYWNAVKERVKVVLAPDFEWFGFARIRHYAHRADLVRLIALQEIGGLYLDLDSLTLRNMDSLSAFPFVMGIQQTIPGAIGGLCNAIMIARSGSPFGRRWLRQYSSFRSKGRDKWWDFHSVKLPLYLHALNPLDLHVLPHDAWFYPLWNRIGEMLLEVKDLEQKKELFRQQYAIHLWHNANMNAFSEFTMQSALAHPGLYGSFCRQTFELLPLPDRQSLINRLTSQIDNQ